MRKKFNVTVVALAVMLLIMPYFITPAESYEAQVSSIKTDDVVCDVVETEAIPPNISEEELNLMALVTMAEAENQCEEGKRLVIDTILNRVDSEHFPNTIYEVVYQKSQFTSMWNGRVEKCVVKEDIRQLVIEEVLARYNYETVFFRANRYSSYGVPLFKVGDHYFSSYM